MLFFDRLLLIPIEYLLISGKSPYSYGNLQKQENVLSLSTLPFFIGLGANPKSNPHPKPVHGAKSVTKRKNYEYPKHHGRVGEMRSLPFLA